MVSHISKRVLVTNIQIGEDAQHFQVGQHTFDLVMLAIPSWLAIVFSVGMAIGPPLVYADQGVSIFRKK